MRVIGAGLGRTGTLSLKTALERLLGEPCYHMFEVMANPDHLPIWHDAIRGATPDWTEFPTGYAAAVDWPAVSFWRELAEAHAEALVLLSTRDADAWWTSANRTILPSTREAAASDDPQRKAFASMALDMFALTFDSIDDEAGCKAGFERHNQQVRDEVSPARLLEWHPGDGWEPICAALDLPVPDEAFPHTNSTEEFLEIRRAAGDRAT